MSSHDPTKPSSPPTDTATGLILCAHGVDGRPGIAERHAEILRRRRLFADVRACCLDGRPGLAESVAAMPASRAVLVPLLMAEGYSLNLLKRQLSTVAATPPILCRPIGVNPRIAALITRRAEKACHERSWAPDAVSLIVVGHGTPRDGRSGQSLAEQVARLVTVGRFRHVTAAYLEQPPMLAEILAQQDAPCLVIGFFADGGPHGEQDVPHLIAAANADASYAGPIGTDPAIVDIIVEQTGLRAPLI